MKNTFVVVWIVCVAFGGCSNSTEPRQAADVEKAPVSQLATPESPHVEQLLEIPSQNKPAVEETIKLEITPAAMPLLTSAIASADEGETVVYSMDWPLGVCSPQHRMVIATPGEGFVTQVVSGVPVSYQSKYGKFISGTVIDYGTRGTQRGLMLRNPDLDMTSIIKSEADSALMAEMLGAGFVDYRQLVLDGKIFSASEIEQRLSKQKQPDTEEG